MRRSRVAALAAALALAAAFAAHSQAAPAAPAQAARPWYADRLAALGFTLLASPQAAPDFRVEKLAGGTASLADFRGKVVLLNFWATWCPPCRAEMPSIQTLWDRTKDRPFLVAAVSVGEQRPTVKAFVDRERYAMPFYLDTKGTVGGLYGASSIPTTFILDKTGRALAYAVGSREYDSPEALALFAELAAR